LVARVAFLVDIGFEGLVEALELLACGDDLGSDRDEDGGLLFIRALLAEQATQQGQILEDRDSLDSLHGPFGDQAADQQGLTVAHGHRGLDVAVGDDGGRETDARHLLLEKVRDFLDFLVHIHPDLAGLTDVGGDLQFDAHFAVVEGDHRRAEGVQSASRGEGHHLADVHQRFLVVLGEHPGGGDQVEVGVVLKG